MFGFDWTILWSLRKQIGIGILAFLIGAYVLLLKHQIATGIEENQVLSKQVTTQGTKILELNSQLNFAESKLADMAAAGARAKQNADFWHKSYDEQHKNMVTKIDNLSNWKPQANEGDCDATKRFLHDYRSNANGLRS